MVTGLAGGLAEYLDVDPVIVRVAFVALALLNGLGIVLYLIGAIVVPSEGARPGDPPARGLGDAGRAASIVVGAALVVIGVAALVSRVGDIDVDWVAVACGALIAVGALLLLSGGRVWRGPLVAAGVILAVSLTPLAVLDVPVTGDAFGDRIERPVTVDQLRDRYEHSFGSMTIDLRGLELPQGTTEVEARSSFGSMQLLVPRDVAVEVVAQVSFGSIEAFGDEASAGPTSVRRTFRTPDYERASRRLSLDVESSFGSVEVLR